MTIYYVDSNAAGSNDGTSWTDAYSDITTALAGSVTTNDTVWVAHDHAHTATVPITYSVPDNVTFVSVNSGTDVYQAGATAQESNDDGGGFDDITITPTSEGFITTFKGLFLEAEDRLQTGTAGHKLIFDDCVWHAASTGTAKGMLLGIDGGLYIFRNCQLDFSGTGHQIALSQAPHIILDNCTSGGTAVTTLFTLSGNGRATIDVLNTDLSQLIATSGFLVDIDSASDDGLTAKVRRCKLPTGFSAHSGTPALRNYIIDIAECHATDGYHYFYYYVNEGTVEEDLVTYLNATYDGTNGFSAKATSSATASPYNPLRYKLATLPAQDLTTAKTITVECTSDASLTDNDIWIEIEHNNNTDEALADVVSTQNTDPVAAGTALTTAGTGTWTSGDTEDYIITKDLGALTNVDNGNVTVYICVGKPSIVANFDLPTIAAT